MCCVVGGITRVDRTWRGLDWKPLQMKKDLPQDPTINVVRTFRILKNENFSLRFLIPYLK